MKLFPFSILLLMLCGSLTAEEPQRVYEGEVTGIFCSACSSHVKAALMQMKGVQAVKIRAAAKNGLPRVRITSTQPVSRESIVQALGEKSKMYDVRNLKSVNP
jgi:copper chaperone CopZ